MHRIIPSDQSEPGHRYGPRVGVPLDVVESEAAEQQDREAAARYGSSSAVIPGVAFEDGHPLDLRTPADLGLVKHAIHEGWNISGPMKVIVRDTMLQIVQQADMARDKINAAKVIVAAAKQDQKQAGTTINIGVNIDVKSMTTEELERQLAECEAIEQGQLPPAG